MAIANKRSRFRQWGESHPAARRIAGMSAAIVFAMSTVVGASVAAQATVPGSPGVPQDSTVVYNEDFQNRPGPTPIVRLTDYTAADGGTYTAAATWLTACNGWIASSAQPVGAAAQVDDCASQGNWNRAQQLSRALGIYNGQTPAAAAGNYALSAYTANNPGVGAVEFRTVANRDFAAGNGRFITFAADVAAINCDASAPLLQFQLINAAGSFVNAGSQVNACTAPGATTVDVPIQGGAGAIAANVTTTSSNGSVLFTGNSIGVRMLNNNGSGGGNDHAVDNIRIVDASPQLDKSFSPASLVAGQNSTLTLTVTNTDELAAKNGWSFTDQLPAGLTVAGPATTTCPAGVLTAPLGGTSVRATGNLSAGMASCTVSVTVTSFDAGTFTNGPDNISSVGLNPPADSTVEFVERAPGIAIVKSAEPSGVADYTVGQTIAYSFVVTNTGNVALNNVTVDETEFTGSGEMSAVACPPAQASTLAPGAQVTCAATYVVTQADVDAGSITNAATATGTPLVGTPPVSEPSEVTVPSEDAAPAITVVKTANPATVSAPGQVVTYSFLVTNTGNVTLTNATVIDSGFSGSGELSAITCPATAASLAPSAQITCTATYTTTQADVDAGTITNSATATGTPPSGTPPVSPPSDTVVDLPPAPAITVEKTAAPAIGGNVGDEISYSFLVTNTGNVTLDEISVTEGDFTGTGEISPVICPTGPLAPQGTATCTATYVLTQADVDAGQIVNAATATGTPPTGPPPVSPPDEVIVDIPEAPGITVVKSADDEALAGIAVGQTVDYSFLVTNTGNVTLTGIEIVEGDFSGTGELSAIDCPAGSLAPTATATCTATYVVTQADVDAGEITNTATAAGTPPSGSPLESDPSELLVPAEVAEPALTIVKSASPATAGAVGDEIVYSFLVTNSGNVTLTDVSVDEGEFSGTGELSAVTCPAASGSLAPGDIVTCTATYTVTQADVDNGGITNTATAIGTPPGLPPIESPPGETEVDIVAAPSLTIVKSADAAAQLEYVVGQTVTYSFLVTNTGNVTLADIAVNEGDFSGSGELSAITCPEGSASLAPDVQTTCEATYVVTQADVDAGEITNTASAVGTTPEGDEIDSPPSEVAVPSTPAAPALTVVKSASPTSASNVGDTITYSFLVTNTGNVTISDAVIDDTEFSGTGELSAITCPAAAATLPPTAQVTCTATYELTQADVDSGELTNTAVAGGTPPVGPPIESPPDAVVVEVPPAPAITVVKTADEAAQAGLVLGQTVTYSFLVTNTGNVTLADVTVEEGSFTGSGEISAIDCPAEPLAPGDTVTCSASYVVTQADVDAGQISNTATAGGTPPSGVPVDSPESQVDVPAPPAPGLSVVKTASSTTATTIGEVLTYTFLVTNTGNVTLADIAIVEGEFSGTGTLSAIDCGEGGLSLAPGAQVSCFASYSVTRADIDAGTISNTATASATPPGGGSFASDPSTAEVETPGPLLASTGFDSGWLAALALALLALGGAIAATRRARFAKA